MALAAVQALARQAARIPRDGYFDANGTTPMHEDALEGMALALEHLWGNPSSSGLQGRAAARALALARETVAETLHTTPEQITFTSGSTEAANALMLSHRQVVISGGEHACVRQCAESIGEIVPLRHDGTPNLAAWQSAVRQPGVDLAVCILINNETGAIAPWGALSDICQAAGVPLACDATQVPGKYALFPEALQCDYVFLSAHKFGGPRGSGILWTRVGARPVRVQIGGKQEHNLRAGTENTAAHVGCAIALALAQQALFRRPRGPISLWRARVMAMHSLRFAVPDIVFHGPLRNSAYTTLSFALPGANSRELLDELQREGWAFNVGSACSKGARSAVLDAMGIDEALERGTVRLSALPSEESAWRLGELIERIIAWQREAARRAP